MHNETELYTSNGVTVTTARLMTPSHTIAISGIASVAAVKTRSRIPLYVCLAIAFIAVGIAIAEDVAGLGVAGLIVFTLIGLCLTYLRGSYWLLLLGTTAGTIKAMRSESEYEIREISEALNKAIVLRS